MRKSASQKAKGGTPLFYEGAGANRRALRMVFRARARIWRALGLVCVTPGR